MIKIYETDNKTLELKEINHFKKILGLIWKIQVMMKYLLYQKKQKLI